MTVESISGFEIRTDLAYDMNTHMWVEVRSPECVRIGMDALGLETSGTLAQLQFVGLGESVKRNSDIGSLEADSPQSHVLLYQDTHRAPGRIRGARQRDQGLFRIEGDLQPQCLWQSDDAIQLPGA